MLVLPSGGLNSYALQRSLRFRSSASAYLSRTPAGASNRTTWTWSGWVKRGQLAVAASSHVLFGYVAVGAADQLRVNFNNDFLEFILYTASTTVGYVQASTVCRDASAWYHVQAVFDTTNATGADRMRLYVNGVRLTALGINTIPPQNSVGLINTPVQHGLGAWTPYNTGAFYDGLLAEVNFIDGQALTPTSFGAFDSVTGVWAPAKYTGSYGTNGFYLPFTDNTALTTASNVGLGKDFSGNGNYWVTNNISIAAGATYDSFTDVPTLTSVTAANYCTLNPLQKGLDAGAVDVLSDGNLHFFSDTTISNYRTWYNTIKPPSGTYYFEVCLYAVGTADTISQRIGFGGQSFYQNGTKTGGVVYGSAWSNTNVLGFAVSPTGTWVHINGTWQGSATLSEINAGTLTHSIGAPTFPLEIICGDFSATTDSYVNGAINFGQQPWAYPAQVPSAAVGINTFNLPDSTIKAGNKYFDVVARNGFGASGGSVASLEFQPDLVWDKARSVANSHNLMDSVRGASKALQSDATTAESTYSTFLTGFNSNGMSFGVGDFGTGVTLVDWCWKKGATPGFDIVTYTGTLTAAGEARIAHSLGVAPAMIITKARSGTSDWVVRHKSLASWNYVVLLDATNAQLDSSASGGAVTAPTSSTFPTNYVTGSNIDGVTEVAYLWSEIPGFSKFGSYTGNGSTDGPFVYCGFRPRYVMVKRTDVAASWFLIDTARNPTNNSANYLLADLVSTEGTDNVLDILSNGFKIRLAAVSENASGGTYIYATFAENPFKHSLAR